PFRVCRAGDRCVRLSTCVVLREIRFADRATYRLEPRRLIRAVGADDRDHVVELTHLGHVGPVSLWVRLGEDELGMEGDDLLDLRPIRALVERERLDHDRAAEMLEARLGGRRGDLRADVVTEYPD